MQNSWRFADAVGRYRRGVMSDHAPAQSPAHIDIGGGYRCAQILIVKCGDVLHQGADHGEGGDHRSLLRQAYLESPAVGEDMLPSFADHGVADQTRTAGVHADHFLVFGPDGHHRVDIAVLERLVERGFDILRCGEYFRVGHGQFNASSASVDATCCGVIPFMQSKCRNGHSRLKQGLQGRFLLTIFACVDSGGV